MQFGKLVISLDFELYWGVRDTISLDMYRANILGEQTVIPRLLETFGKYDVRATFAVVGFLFFEKKEELLRHVPAQIPHYQDPAFSPYEGYFDGLGANWKEDPYHFCPHLIALIREQPQHELATHTYSHYYCLEPGQTAADFEADLGMAIEVAAREGIRFETLVFPRNQYNNDYLEVCRRHGINCVRSNESSWIYEPRNRKQETLMRRGLRLLDTYVPLSGNHAWDLRSIPPDLPVNVPSSAFLRPYLPQLAFLEKMRLARIKRSMTHAAQNGLVYHLWWHPHNFGIHQNENFAFLEEILKHYRHLHAVYGFESVTMGGVAREIRAYHEQHSR
ncbi:MAG: polysaccharide deacetylase [Chitinophagaceae bacterium]|nr:MAG: polysaccharide deacetylase [Chitinophagaceae bacterium]